MVHAWWKTHTEATYPSLTAHTATGAEKGTGPIQQLFQAKFAKQPPPVPPPRRKRTPGETSSNMKAPPGGPTHQAAPKTGPTPYKSPRSAPSTQQTPLTGRVAGKAPRPVLSADDGLPTGSGVVFHARSKLSREAQARTQPHSLEVKLRAAPAGRPGRLESMTTSTGVGPQKG